MSVYYPGQLLLLGPPKAGTNWLWRMASVMLESANPVPKTTATPGPESYSPASYEFWREVQFVGDMERDRVTRMRTCASVEGPLVGIPAKSDEGGVQSPFHTFLRTDVTEDFVSSLLPNHQVTVILP